jgi:SAM-dependent methyltransferase
MHDNSLRLFTQYALGVFAADSKVLEVGPDLLPSSFQRVADGRFASWDTADLIAGPGGQSVTLPMSDEYRIPAEQGTFDIVVSASVMEHVRRPWLWLPELVRVCRPGGVVITITPVSWPEHKNEQVPFDGWRILSDGMSVLLEDSGLEAILLKHESLEPAAGPGRRWYPGESYRFLRRSRPIVVEKVAAAADRLAWRPRSAAVDCIAIGRKPSN